MKIFKIFLFFFILQLSVSNAQVLDLKKEFHEDRREQLRMKMPENSVAIFVSNPQQKRSISSYFKFKQNNDLFYFSGVNEPNTILFIFKNEVLIHNQMANEILFVSPKDKTKELWDGIMLGEAGASQKSGVKVVLSNQMINDLSFIPENMSKVYGIFPAFEETKNNDLLRQFSNKIQEKYTLQEKMTQSWLNELRGIKTPEEIAIIREAVRISGEGHIAAMKTIKLGISERQIQGVHEFVHRTLDAEDAGYLPIIGAGNNGCILHYHENNKTNLQNRLVLMDVGAEYRGYTGDITRTVPVNGKFNKEEKLLYELVLKALNAGIDAAKSGQPFSAIDKACRTIIDEGLVELGLVKKGEKHTFFPHGVSHHLGLDVHDRGEYGNLKPGMIITIEPGIYIPDNSPVDRKWWGIGIRIEDNVLITKNGNENLSAFVPKTVADIESIMGTSEILQLLNK